jgi:hypothetical protein
LPNQPRAPELRLRLRETTVQIPQATVNIGRPSSIATALVRYNSRSNADFSNRTTMSLSRRWKANQPERKLRIWGLDTGIEG